MRKRVYNGFIKVYKDHGFEVVKVTNSVAFLIFVVDWMKVILIKQNRKPMKRRSNPTGVILEAPAGRFDRKVGVKGLVIAEAAEEVGVTVAKSDIDVLNHGRPMALSPGVLTERMYLAIATVRSQQVSKGRNFGLASEHERIKRILVPVSELETMVFDDMKTATLVSFFRLHGERQCTKR